MKNKRLLKNHDIDHLKKITRILFIDDEDRTRLINYLDREGWQARQVIDLNSMENIDLKDSHIVFTDIMGIGKLLEKENEGLDIVVSIKKKFPEKKVALYSSKSTHDIFHEANDLVDKRIFKRSGDFEQFRLTAEELSKKCFSWDFVIHEIFEKIKGDLPEGYAEGDLSTALTKSVGYRGTANRAKIRKILRIGKTSLDVLMPLLSLYLQYVK